MFLEPPKAQDSRGYIIDWRKVAQQEFFTLKKFYLAGQVIEKNLCQFD